MYKLLIVDQMVSAGGVERYLFGLINGFMQMEANKEWDITLLLRNINSGGHKFRWPDELLQGNIKVQYFPENRIIFRLLRSHRIFNIPGTGWALRILGTFLATLSGLKISDFSDMSKHYIEKICSSGKFDLVFFTYPYAMECPVVNNHICSIPHDFNYKHPELGTIPEHVIPVIDRQMVPWLENCSRLIVSSNFIADEIKRFYPDYYEKVSVVRAGVAKEITDIPNGKLPPVIKKEYILTTGWIAPHKNQKIVLQALHILKNRGFDICIVFTGPNSELLNYEAKDAKQIYQYLQDFLFLAEDLKLEKGNDYIGLGYVEDNTLSTLYKNAQLLVMPTLYEAGSFPVIEAMCNKCPVLCSNIPPLVEQVELLGNNALTFNPHDPQDLADKIEYILKNKPIIQDYVDQAFIKVNMHYNWKKAAEKYFDIFKSIVLSPYVPRKINLNNKELSLNKRVSYLDDQFYLEGWFTAETGFRWSCGKSASISFTADFKPDEGYHLLINAAAYNPQSITILINKKSVGKIELTDVLKDYNLIIEHGILKKGKNRILFRLEKYKKPDQRDKRGLGIAIGFFEFKGEEK